MCTYDRNKTDPVEVESIKHLSSKEQAHQIAGKISKISQEYDPLQSDDVTIPKFENSSKPKFQALQVKKKLKKLRVNNAVTPEDLPQKLVKYWCKPLSVPLCHLVNSFLSMRFG